MIIYWKGKLEIGEIMNPIQMINEKLEKIKGLDKLIIGTAFGMIISVPIGMYAFSPKTTYNVDDNGDGIKDLVVRTNAGFEYLFIADTKGNLEYVEKRQ